MPQIAIINIVFCQLHCFGPHFSKMYLQITIQINYDILCIINIIIYTCIYLKTLYISNDQMAYILIKTHIT
jgi:hypothetical protein